MSVESRISKYKADIADLEAGIADSATPAEVKKSLEEALEIAKSDLAALEEKVKEEEQAKKKAAKKEPKKKEPKPKKEKEKIKVGDKDFDEISPEEALEIWKKRREQAKASKKKAKTKSIFSKVASNLGNAANKAVQFIPKEDIQENPEKVIKDIEKIEDAIDDALTVIKKVLEKYAERKDLKLSAEAKKDLESIENFAKDIKKKYI